MTDEKFEKLVTIIHSEPICHNTYMCLKEEWTEGGSGTWGWNSSLKNLQEHFLYIFILGNIIQYNIDTEVQTIRTEIALDLINGGSLSTFNLSKQEERFYKLWVDASIDCDFKELQQNAKKLCKYLSSLGYKMRFTLYEDPSKAVSTALKTDRFVPDDEPKFGEFLKNFTNSKH